MLGPTDKIRIDFHCHAFPEPAFVQTLKFGASIVAEKVPLLKYGVAQAQWYAREISNKAATRLHQAQTYIRHLPHPLWAPLDQISSIYPIAHLALESSLEHLVESLERNRIDHAVLIAHPPFIPNDFVVEAAASDPRIIAAVNISPDTSNPGEELRRLLGLGAKILKIHPAADGLGPDSSHYLSLLDAARAEGIPVILHTGCMHSNLLYKNPAFGDVKLFEPWFAQYGDIQFVLAHLNMHEPLVALDLARRHSNIWVDTSWQPAEMIAEACRQIGSRRVLFATDWPFVGNNHQVGLERIDEAVAAAEMTEAQADDVRGRNAAQLLGLDLAGRDSLDSGDSAEAED